MQTASQCILSRCGQFLAVVLVCLPSSPQCGLTCQYPLATVAGAGCRAAIVFEVLHPYVPFRLCCEANIHQGQVGFVVQEARLQLCTSSCTLLGHLKAVYFDWRAQRTSSTGLHIQIRAASRHKGQDNAKRANTMTVNVNGMRKSTHVCALVQDGYAAA